MKTFVKTSYVAPKTKFAVLESNAVLCNSQDPQSRTSGIGLGDYNTYSGTDTGSDF